jgi:hypothetical protein
MDPIPTGGTRQCWMVAGFGNQPLGDSETSPLTGITSFTDVVSGQRYDVTNVFTKQNSNQQLF